MRNAKLRFNSCMCKKIISPASRSCLQHSFPLYSRPGASAQTPKGGYYHSRILFTSSLSLNFQFQLPLSFQWAASGLPKHTSYSITHLDPCPSRNARFCLHSIPLVILCVCVCTYRHILYKFRSLPMVWKNQYFSG